MSCKKIIKNAKKIPYIGRRLKIELKGSLGHVAELSYPELRKKSSKYFNKAGQGGLTFTYGHEKLDDNNFMIILFIIFNFFFKIFFPFCCFDQYILLKNKK